MRMCRGLLLTIYLGTMTQNLENWGSHQKRMNHSLDVLATREHLNSPWAAWATSFTKTLAAWGTIFDILQVCFSGQSLPMIPHLCRSSLDPANVLSLSISEIIWRVYFVRGKKKSALGPAVKLGEKFISSLPALRPPRNPGGTTAFLGIFWARNVDHVESKTWLWTCSTINLARLI